MLRCCSFHQDYEDYDEQTEKPTESTMAQWHNGTMAQRSMSSILDIFGHRCHRFMLQARPLAMSQGEARTVSIVTRPDLKDWCFQSGSWRYHHLMRLRTKSNRCPHQFNQLVVSTCFNFNYSFLSTYFHLL